MAKNSGWIAAEDVNRLVREIDVALNGVDAAPQAKLCDITAQVRKAAREGGPILQRLGAATASTVAALDRDAGGRIVREAWMRWALTQPNPKPSWLVPYDDLGEADKEADRQIFEACRAAEPKQGMPSEWRDALVKAEAALADIGDADREPGDDVAWCERRAAQALPAVRTVLAAAPQPATIVAVDDDALDRMINAWFNDFRADHRKRMRDAIAAGLVPSVSPELIKRFRLAVGTAFKGEKGADGETSHPRYAEDAASMAEVLRVLEGAALRTEAKADVLGRCCYGGRKPKSACASCAAWKPEPDSNYPVVAWCDSTDPEKVANVALARGSFGCEVPLVYAHSPAAYPNTNGGA